MPHSRIKKELNTPITPGAKADSLIEIPRDNGDDGDDGEDDVFSNC